MTYGPDDTANRVAARIEQEIGPQPDATRETLVERLTWIYDELFAAAHYEFGGSLTLSGLWQKLELTPAAYVDEDFALANSDLDVVVPSSGIYRLDAHVSIQQGTGDASVEIGLSKNSFDIVPGGRARFDVASDGYSAASVSAIVEMSNADVISLAAREISSTGTATVDFNDCGFNIQRVR